MLYNYKEAIGLYGNDYNLKKALLNKQIFKVEKGIYSDGENNYTTIELVLKKYSHAFLVKDSALHLIGFINEEPAKIHIGTARNSLRIKDDRIQQHFYSNLDVAILSEGAWYKHSHLLSRENIKTHSTDNGNRIRLFNLKALFYDVVRSHRTYPKPVLFDLLERFKKCPYFYGLDKWELEYNLRYENIVGDFEFLEPELNKKLEDVFSEVWRRNLDVEFGLDDY